MKLLYIPIFLLWCLLAACNSNTGEADTAQTDRRVPREATDPVPEPTTQPDTAESTANRTAPQAAGTQEVLYRLMGNEPFWSLTIGRPYSTYRSMEGDSISFAFRAPNKAAGRQEEWVQLFMLGENSWALLRKGNSPCSDGMSDREHTYTATVWLNGQLLDGCANKP